MKNVYIAVSPFQLLNCIEARYHFNTSNNILILVRSSLSKNSDQMRHLLSLYEWDNTVYLELPSRFMEYICFPTIVRSLLKSAHIEHVRSLFVGEYRSAHINHLVNTIDAKRVYLVDDGMSTLSYDKYRNNIGFKISFRNMIYAIMGYKTKWFKCVFFTCFSLEEHKTIENTYEYIRKLRASIGCNDVVMFVGQPLVELSIVGQAYYKQYIKKIIGYFHGNKFVYILHRGNDKLFIKSLAKELSFEYLEFDNLLELELLKREMLPCKVATFYSTGIYSLSKMFANIDYIAFKIGEEDIHRDILPMLNIEAYYEEFEKANILVKDL